jgi:hypothetical protein
LRKQKLQAASFRLQAGSLKVARCKALAFVDVYMQLKFLRSLGHQQIKYFNRNERKESAKKAQRNAKRDFHMGIKIL